MTTIFHLITEDDWSTARQAGVWRPPSLSEEGFIHCSRDEEQMVRVARRLYPDRADLLALELDTEKLDCPVVSEPSRSGEIYPHIYGPLELGAVAAVRRVSPDGQGGFAIVAY